MNQRGATPSLCKLHRNNCTRIRQCAALIAHSGFTIGSSIIIHFLWSTFTLRLLQWYQMKQMLVSIPNKQEQTSNIALILSDDSIKWVNFSALQLCWY